MWGRTLKTRDRITSMHMIANDNIAFIAALQSAIYPHKLLLRMADFGGGLAGAPPFAQPSRRRFSALCPPFAHPRAGHLDAEIRAMFDKTFLPDGPAVPCAALMM